MPKVYYTRDLTEAILVKDHLLHHGIAADVINRGAGRIPYEGIASEVWVANDIDGEEVRRLIRDFLKRRKEAPIAASWSCSQCKEENPGEFESCWNCGQLRVASTNG